MDKKLIIAMVLIFLMGWASASIFAYMHDYGYDVQQPVERTNGNNNPSGNMLPENAKSLNNDVVIGQNTAESREKPSPKGRISTEDIRVFNDEVVLKITNPQWAVFTDSKSMDPVIDSDSKAIEIVPEDESEIQVGDIVAYGSKIKKATVIHRIVFIGRDQNGWYALMKGDNNDYNDPERVRFEQVKRVVVAIIY